MAKQLSCGIEFMRGVLLLLNILFVLFGLTLIGFGIYVKVDNNFEQILGKLADVSQLEGQAIRSLAWIMIAAGGITLLISLFGCVGALWHNRCLLYMYALILGILLILELGGFITAFAYKSKVRETYDKGLATLFSDAMDKGQTGVIAAFDTLQKQMHCCGANDSEDYIKHNHTLPDSCYDKKGNVYEKGCAQAVIDFLEAQLPIFGGVLGGFLLIELLGLIAAIALAVALKHAPDDRYSSNPKDVFSGMVRRR